MEVVASVVAFPDAIVVPDNSPVVPVWELPDMTVVENSPEVPVSLPDSGLPGVVTELPGLELCELWLNPGKTRVVPPGRSVWVVPLLPMEVVASVL